MSYSAKDAIYDINDIINKLVNGIDYRHLKSISRPRLEEQFLFYRNKLRDIDNLIAQFRINPRQIRDEELHFLFQNYQRKRIEVDKYFNALKNEQMGERVNTRDLEEVYTLSDKIYKSLDSLTNRKIDLQFIKKVFNELKSDIDYIQSFINKNDLLIKRSDDINNIDIYRLFRKNVDKIMLILKQLESLYQMLYATDHCYEMYQKETDEVKKEKLLAVFFNQFTKYNDQYKRIIVIDLKNIDDTYFKKLDELLKIYETMLGDKKVDYQEENRNKDSFKDETLNNKTKPKEYTKLTVNNDFRMQFEGLFNRNRSYLVRPYNRIQSINALNELNDFLINYPDIIDYLKTVDVNTLDSRDKSFVENINRVLKDIGEYSDIVVNKNLNVNHL